jgi:hypothetical protein
LTLLKDARPNEKPKGSMFIARVGIARTFKRIPVPQERDRLTQPTLLPSRPCYP